MRVGDLREELARIEHERWSDWQDYLHSKCSDAGDGYLTIPAELVERWQRQIDTPYSQLSERERASDMEQVNRYWPLIEDLVALGEYLEKEGTSAKELLAKLEGDYVIARWDTIDWSDPMGGER